jgi:hypothetical protein
VVKYLKVYQGIVTSNPRDYGHPEDKKELFNSLEDVAKTFGSQKNERYFGLESITIEQMQYQYEKYQKEKIKKEREQRKFQIQDQMTRLQRELRLLEEEGD